MKCLVTTALLYFIVGFSAHAVTTRSDPHAGHAVMNTPAQTSSDAAMVDGVVKKIDKGAGKVTVSHGPLSNLKMPAMTMVFRVKDAAWLDRMQVDSKIRFQADSINGVLTIVRFEPAK